MPPGPKVTTNYATNQFYNFSRYEGGRNPDMIGKTDNPRFLWPSPTNTNANTRTTFPLQRGYMRMITEGYADAALGSKLKHKRFHFQFNPDVLVRSVTARNDVQFWMNQDPGQLVSPIPGDANFAFEFILNREAEMASGTVASGTTQASPGLVKNKAGHPSLQGNTGTGVPGWRPQTAGHPSLQGSTATGLPGWQQTSVISKANQVPNQIGVLADLLVFDSIIGQGINADLIASITKQYQANVIAAQVAANAAPPVDGEDKVVPTEQLGVLSKTLQLSTNNSAFLISQPVRIVFSSLYMVEGFITSSTVTFNKFNLAMVPTQCTVSINMQAMYIGFAARDTFLTTTLRDANANNEDLANTTDAEALAIGVITPFKQLIVRLGTLKNDAIKPSNFLNKNKDPIELRWAVKRTDECKEAMDRGWITGFTAALTLKFYYLGHDSGTGAGYYNTNKKEVILEQTVNAVYGHFDTGSRLNPRNWDDKSSQADFGFTWKLARAVPDASKAWDDRNGARYRIEANVEITIESSFTSSVSKQEWKIDMERKFHQELNTFNFTQSIQP